MSVPPTLSQSSYGLTSPAVRAVAVTPNDSTDLATPARAILVTVGGLVSVIPIGQSTAVLLPVGDNGILPVSVSRVRSTGTTATGIFALN